MHQLLLTGSESFAEKKQGPWDIFRCPGGFDVGGDAGFKLGQTGSIAPVHRHRRVFPAKPGQGIRF